MSILLALFSLVFAQCNWDQQYYFNYAPQVWNGWAGLNNPINAVVAAQNAQAYQNAVAALQSNWNSFSNVYWAGYPCFQQYYANVPGYHDAATALLTQYNLQARNMALLGQYNDPSVSQQYAIQMQQAQVNAMNAMNAFYTF